MRPPWFILMIGTALSVMLSPSAIRAQGVLRGLVVSDTGGTPLVGAVVEIPQLRLTSLTDPRGAFEFTDIPAGRYRILARFVGYEAHSVDVRVRDTQVLRLILKLAPVPTRLDSLSVVVPSPEAYNPLMRGFGERRRSQPGHFLDRQDLIKYEQTDLAGVLRLFHVPIRRTLRTNRPYAAARPGRSLSHNDACPVQVFLDGQILANQIDTFDISSVRVMNLAGIEYYESLARIPIQYARGDWECGVLILWSRLRIP